MVASVWSILVAAPLNVTVGRLGLTDPDARLVGAIALASCGGYAAARLWNALAARNEGLRAGASRTAWDLVLSQAVAPWVQVWTNDGRVIVGWPKVVALDAETDKTDVYLRDPEWVDAHTQLRSPMEGIAGVLIPASAIELVQVYEPSAV